MRRLAAATEQLYLAALFLFIIAPLIVVAATSINTATSSTAHPGPMKIERSS